MAARLLADGLTVLHLAFIAFVLAGGLLVRRHPAMAFAHLPAVAWAIFTEATSTVCPLTPLENLLRQQAGQQGYAGGFVEHYLLPILYPAGLTADVQLVLAVVVVVVNGIVYLPWARRLFGGRRRRPGDGDGGLA